MVSSLVNFGNPTQLLNYWISDSITNATRLGLGWVRPYLFNRWNIRAFQKVIFLKGSAAPTRRLKRLMKYLRKTKDERRNLTKAAEGGERLRAVKRCPLNLERDERIDLERALLCWLQRDKRIDLKRARLRPAEPGSSSRVLHLARDVGRSHNTHSIML